MAIALSRVLFMDYYSAQSNWELAPASLTLNSVEFRSHGPLTLAMRPSVQELSSEWLPVAEVWAVAKMDLIAYHSATLQDFNDLDLKFIPIDGEIEKPSDEPQSRRFT